MAALCAVWVANVHHGQHRLAIFSCLAALGNTLPELSYVDCPRDTVEHEVSGHSRVGPEVDTNAREWLQGSDNASNENL